MFKNVKKALFALVLAFVAALAFACGKDEEIKEANNENCKEFCETCPTCNNASAETCTEFCPTAPACNAASKETCKAFQDFVAPTSFFVDGDTVVVGATKAVYVDDELWDPENCDKTLVYVSEDPSIATVDANGVVTGVRPGKVNIIVYSPLNKDLEAQEVEFEVKESLADQAVVDRELNTILAALPSFVAGEFDLPKPWNTNVKVSYKIAGQAVEKLDSATVEADTMVKLAIALELNDAATSYQADIWLVKDAVVNEFVVIDSVASLLANYFDKYVKGAKVDADLELVPSIFGCTINWSTSLATAIDAEGKFGAPSEDKAVTLTAGIRYGSGSRNIDFNVVAKGYTAEEKADAIMASTFAKMAGKSFNTSIVLPEFDDKFGAKLSYTSLDTAVYDNTGKLVAAVTEAKDVKFKVKIEYDIAAKAADNFVAERELTIHAIPANAASQFLEAALATEGYKKYQKVVYAPWGQTAGNIVFEALPGMVWDVEAVKLDARLQDGYQVFSQASAGAALKLDAQYLRYQLVSIKGTYTYNETTADIVLFFNIGISKTPQNIISAIWRSSAQKDTSLSEIQGKYDLAGNVSYFDKKIGYVTETYGSGYFSGWSVSAVAGASDTLKLAKVPGSTNDPAWKCAVVDKIEGADYSGVNKLLVTVKGTAGEKVLFKTNDSKEDWVTLTGETQELSFDLAITFDTNKFPMVVFCNPGEEGTGHEIEISSMKFTGTGAPIDLLNAKWRSLDEGVYNITPVSEGQIWQTFMMEVMTVYIREKDGKVYIDPANVNGGIAGAGGNWGVWYVNTTDKPVNIEVGVYGDASLKYAEGHATSSAVGSRLNIAMDGYALGFVADSTGKIVHGSNNSKLQNGMADMRGVLGGKTYKVGDKVSAAMFNAMQLEGKAEKFEAVYTAADNLLFAVAEAGTFKKVTAEDGTVSYVAIKEGEEVTEKYAPKYAKGAALTAEQYAELDAATKALVTVEYKAKEAVTYEVPNLFGDSANGATVNYLTIPANGYAMSWKYQFYGVGNPATVYPFCQTGETLAIEHFQVHPLSSMDAEYATNYVKAAEEFTTISEEEYPSVIYKAADNLLFVQNDKGDFKKETKDNKTSYVAIKEGEEVAAANRYAPTYPTGTVLTTAQYKALDKDAKENVSISYFETNVNAARARYNNLSGDTLADVFPAERLTALETKAAAFLDADITALLAAEPAADADRSQFAKDLAIMWSRLYKTEGDEIVNKLSTQITGALTKKAAFDAKYAEYAAIDLHITYDYNGGYIQGFWKDTDKATFLSTLFLPDLYNFMVAKGAWADAVAPTLEEFCDTAYWSNYAKNEETVLTKYLFTPKVQGDTVNENYHDIIEGSNKFFNSPEGHKYIALMDYVDESTRSGNMGGQDAWGRKGEQYAAMEWLQKQSYYSTLSDAERTKDLTTYGGNPVMVTNSGAVLGAYRFAQWVGGTGAASYKSWMPNNVWSNVFDRQYTQEHSTQIYHCTDLTVKLQDEPYKEGFKFLGWKFEDGKDAVITGSMFADVTVYASWAPSLEESIEEALKVQLTGVFAGPSAKPDYRVDNTPTGTIVDQVNTMGLGDYAFIIGDKLFVIGKYAAIELGKDATEDITPDKAALQPYGIDNDTNNSTGIINTNEGPKNQDTYGYGALYHNAGEHKVIITDIVNTYGRTISGATYGYNRYLFHYDAEKQAYVGTLLVDAEGKANVAGISVTLEPGDFLWCPMTAERYCLGLTDRDNAVVGVLRDGIEVQIISTKEYLPADSPAWYSVEFFNEDGTLNKGFYDVAGKEFTAPVVEKKYYKFLGWSENKEATAADTLPTAIEKSAKYYPVFEKLDIYDEITVDPATDGSVTATYATIAEAISKSMDDAVITILAGTYDEVLVIDRPVQLVGPNAAKKGYETRDPEALFTGSISVSAGVNGVVIKGMAFGGDDSKFVEEAYTGNSNKCKILFTAATEDFAFINNYVTAGRTVLELGINTNTVISGNFFNWTAETATAYSYWRPIRMDGKSTDYTFQGNKVVQSVAGSGSTGFYDILYFGNVAGTTNIIGNDISFKSYNWAFNVAASAGTVNIKYNRIAGAAAGEGAGFAIEGGVSELNIIGNIFEEVAGTTYSAKTCPTVNVKYNQFKQAQYKPRLKTDATLVHEGNYIAATSVTAVSGYKTVTLDGNFNDMDAFLAAAKDVESAVELKDQSVWSSTYYPTYMYLNTGNKSALYWGAIYLVKSSIFEGYYEVVGAKVSGGSFTGACDFTITASESNADDYAVLTGIAVGEFVKFASDPAALAAEAFETPVAFTVYNFGAK